MGDKPIQSFVTLGTNLRLKPEVSLLFLESREKFSL